ncbi:hypothetical protein ACE6ED_07385 [Paenibacillus sp. CN-4]|uniref:hypothetical protein n=1 Tax=Paenibacillus nanchangensis TaxID=3348343 RepID=UPI003978FF4E
MNNTIRSILAAIGIVFAYAVGAWLYYKGSQIIFHQTIRENEYKGIVVSSFFLYLLIMVPLIYLVCFALDRKIKSITLKWLFSIIASILVGFILPFLATGGRVFSPEGQLLLCFFIPPAVILGMLFNLLFAKKQ